MQNLSSFLFVALLFSLFACATLESNYQYDKGMEALELSDHKAAIVYLKEAVRLDPERVRNHNGLAAAYLSVGWIQEGWPHARKAVDLDPSNTEAVGNFNEYFVLIVQEVGLASDESLKDIRRKLGEPDEEYDRDGSHWLRYGNAAFETRDEKLLRVIDLAL